MEYVESSVRATLNTSVSDVRQIAGTLTVVTSKPEQNTNIMLVGARVCALFLSPFSLAILFIVCQMIVVVLVWRIWYRIN